MDALPDPPPRAAAGRLRWAVVALLVACAALSGTRDAGTPSPGTAALALPAGIGLAVAIIVARQWALRAASPRARLRAVVATYLLCAALGLAGAALVLAGDDPGRGVLFALGGAIFTLGTPPGVGRR